MRSKVPVIGAAAATLALSTWALTLSRELSEAGEALLDSTAHVVQMASELQTTRADADLLVDTLGVLSRRFHKSTHVI